MYLLVYTVVCSEREIIRVHIGGVCVNVRSLTSLSAFMFQLMSTLCALSVFTFRQKMCVCVCLFLHECFASVFVYLLPCEYARHVIACALPTHYM